MPLTGKRPNILFAIADDASHMSAYGNRFVSTPHFDRVAREGVLFRNAFTSNPKCAPSRASILTGRQTWELEEACNHFGVFSAKFGVYPDMLEGAGYFVGYTGKGWGPGDCTAGGFKRNPAGPAFNRVKLTPPSKTISPKDYTANFGEFLEARPAGAPFCFWYGGHEPHRKYEPGEGIANGKKTTDVDVPKYLPDDEIVKSDLCDYAYETEWFDHHLGLMLRKLEEIGELENTLVVVTSDNGMPFPRVKGQMYEADFHLPLAMRWGAACEGGRAVEDLVSLIDLAPTFLEVAGVDVPDEMTGRSLRDILESRESGWIDSGRDRVYMGRECHDLGREGDLGYPVRVVRTPQHLYIRNFAPDRWPAGNPETGYTNVDSSPTKTLILDQHERGDDTYYDLAFGKRPLEELYDITKDSECLHNLANDPEFATLKAMLWDDLQKTLTAQKDPRILGNGDIFETYEYVGRGKHSWKAYLDGTFEKQKY